MSDCRAIKGDGPCTCPSTVTAPDPIRARLEELAARSMPAAPGLVTVVGRDFDALLAVVQAVTDVAQAQAASSARWSEAISEADNDTDRGYATGRAHAAEQAELSLSDALAAALSTPARTTRDGGTER